MADEPRSWPGRHVLDLDLRSLALLRIACGILLLCDVLTRWSDLTAHYSDRGVLSRTLLLETEWFREAFSLHMMTGDPFNLQFLFFAQLLAAASLLIGYQTRWATLISWFFLISIHNRNPLLLNGGDVYLRLMLFWMLFLPWGQTWSVDARRGKPDINRFTPRLLSDGLTVRSLFGLAVLLQICFVYWFAALPKTDPAWTSTYTAIEVSLYLDQFLTPTGLFFRETFDFILKPLTFLIFNWEFWGPFLLWFPFDRGQVRTVALSLFVAMHVGFGFMLELGLFPWVGACMPLVLLPTWFWQGPARRLTAALDDFWGNRWSDPTPMEREPLWSWLPREALACFLLLYVALWNFGNEPITPEVQVPSKLTWIGRTLRLDQRWNMFSPGPYFDDGWFVVEGTRRSGGTVDLRTGASEVDWDKPDFISQTFKNQRRRRFMYTLWMRQSPELLASYCDFIGREWSPRRQSLHGIAKVRVTFLLERTRPDLSEEPLQKILLMEYDCQKREPISTSPTLLVDEDGSKEGEEKRSAFSAPGP